MPAPPIHAYGWSASAMAGASYRSSRHGATVFKTNGQLSGAISPGAPALCAGDRRRPFKRASKDYRVCPGPAGTRLGLSVVSSRAAQSSSRCWAPACSRDAVVPSSLVVAKLKAGVCRPVWVLLRCFREYHGTRPSGAHGECKRSGDSVGVGDRHHHRDVADAVAHRSHCRATAISC
jgi:hypothetical protein